MAGIVLTVLGFGEGNYQEHKMQELADRGNGNHAYIDNILEAKKVLVNISNGEYNEAQIAAFISVYLMRSISVNELLGFRDALLELCRPFDLDGMESIDIVGTGGDGKNTFNIFFSYRTRRTKMSQICPTKTSFESARREGIFCQKSYLSFWCAKKTSPFGK